MSERRIPEAQDVTARTSGLGRRDFLKVCGQVAALLGLEASMAPQIAQALTSGKRPPFIWLQLSECTGCSEAFLRSTNPWVDDLLLSRISDDYHEVLMAPSGDAATKSLDDVLRVHSGEFFCVVEGSIPTASGGVFGQIGGKTMLQLAHEVCGSAKAVISIGTCSSFGGIAAAAPNPTGAKGVRDAIGVPAINIPGCPPNPLVFTATIVNYLLAGKLPTLDALGRPTFAYAKTVHDKCPRKLDPVQYGPCLKDRGCKGPQTKNTCPTQKFNEGMSWCIEVDHPCIGCANPNPEFWDKTTRSYYRY